MDVTPDQLAFMSGAETANDIDVVLPLLRAGLIRPNPNPPPMFIRTLDGDALLSDHGYELAPRRVTVEIALPASAAGGTG